MRLPSPMKARLEKARQAFRKRVDMAWSVIIGDTWFPKSRVVCAFMNHMWLPYPRGGLICLDCEKRKAREPKVYLLRSVPVDLRLIKRKLACLFSGHHWHHVEADKAGVLYKCLNCGELKVCKKD